MTPIWVLCCLWSGWEHCCSRDGWAGRWCTVTGLALPTALKPLPEGSAVLHKSDQVLPFAIFRRADPLCIARWSVLSLLIKYCGSSFEA